MSFYEWLNELDIRLGRWVPVTKYEHWGYELQPLSEEETEAILKRYLSAKGKENEPL